MCGLPEVAGLQSPCFFTVSYTGKGWWGKQSSSIWKATHILHPCIVECSIYHFQIIIKQARQAYPLQSLDCKMSVYRKNHVEEVVIEIAT